MGVTVSSVLDRVDELRATVAAAEGVVAVGARTHWDVGDPTTGGVEVQAPGGIVTYDPAELTVTVGAGITVGELNAVLGEAGQECPLDARAPEATVGGTLATGLSGPRRLRYGPLRDRLLEVRFVTADGRLVKGGGPTVKNVTGYDVPRLLVGSMGTIGVIVQVTLRCQPRARVARWITTRADPFEARRRMFRRRHDTCAARRASGRRRRRGEYRPARRRHARRRGGGCRSRLARRFASGTDLGAAESCA
jgi:FAD/FMN-containing dehydrogenase